MSLLHISISVQAKREAGSEVKCVWMMVYVCVTFYWRLNDMTYFLQWPSWGIDGWGAQIHCKQPQEGVWKCWALDEEPSRPGLVSRARQ